MFLDCNIYNNKNIIHIIIKNIIHIIIKKSKSWSLIGKVMHDLYGKIYLSFTKSIIYYYIYKSHHVIIKQNISKGNAFCYIITKATVLLTLH